VAELIGQKREDDLIARYFSGLVEEIGDDVAAVRPEKGTELLVSTDTLVEDVHFTRDVPAHLVGHKALRANVSDIVASGGTPHWLTLALSLPEDLPCAWLEAFVTGFEHACRDTNTDLIGGDLTRSVQEIGITVTALGTVPKGERLTRAGARAGDLVAVTGTIGDAHLGLEALRGVLELDRPQPWIERHFQPPFRHATARSVANLRLASAMMDLSDGLATDLPRLCSASGSGCRIALERLPLSDGAHAAGLDVLKAFTAGEDFELVMTVPQVRWEALLAIGRLTGVPLHAIGEVTVARDLTLTEKGTEIPWPKGWQHFS